MSRAILRGATASLGLVVLLGGLPLPLVGLMAADEPSPFCCSKGRCCCAGDTAGTDDRPCLRRGCGCEREDATLVGAPLRIEAVLPGTSPPPHPEPRALERGAALGRLLTRPHAPPVPPPRPPLSV